MIYYLLMLFGFPFATILQSTAQKRYSLQRKSSNVLMFSTVTTFIALCFFLVSSGFQLDFVPELLPYSLVFALTYASGWITTMLALRLGSLALTSLFSNFSLLFPTVYGILQGEALSVPVVTGMVMLLTSLVLVNLSTKEGFAFSFKWLLCVLSLFCTNGICNVAQTISKQTLGDSYTHEFMVIALSVATVLLLGCTLVNKRTQPVADFKVSLPYALVNGIGNGLYNFLTMVLIGVIPNTVLFPTKSAISMGATFLLAFIAYRERFSKIQYIGYALGAISVVLLNL